jgi:hypothetical protein
VKIPPLEKVTTFNQSQNYPPHGNYPSHSQQYGDSHLPHSGSQEAHLSHPPTINSPYQPVSSPSRSPIPPIQPSPFPGPSSPPAQQTPSKTKKIVTVVAVIFAIILLGSVLWWANSNRSGGKTPDKTNSDEESNFDSQTESTKPHNPSSSKGGKPSQKPPSHSKPETPSKPPPKPDKSYTPTAEITLQQLKEEISVIPNRNFYIKFAEKPLQIKMSHLEALKTQLMADGVITISVIGLLTERTDQDINFKFLYFYNYIQELLQEDKPFTAYIIRELARIEPTILGYDISLDLIKVHEKVQSCVKLLPAMTLKDIWSDHSLGMALTEVLENHRCDHIPPYLTNSLLLLNYFFPRIKADLVSRYDDFEIECLEAFIKNFFTAQKVKMILERTSDLFVIDSNSFLGEKLFIESIDFKITQYGVDGNSLEKFGNRSKADFQKLLFFATPAEVELKPILYDKILKLISKPKSDFYNAILKEDISILSIPPRSFRIIESIIKDDYSLDIADRTRATENIKDLFQFSIVYEKAHTKGKINDDFLDYFFKNHPILFTYKVRLNDLETLEEKVSDYLFERFKDDRVSENTRITVSKFKKALNLTLFHLDDRRYIFPLYYYFDRVKDKLGISGVDLEKLERYLKASWQVKVLTVISEKKTEHITDEDISFIQRVDFNPLPFYSKLINLEKFRGTSFNSRPELPPLSL